MGAKIKITDKDLGWNDFFARALRMEDVKVKVGILDGTPQGDYVAEGSALSVAEIAVVNEFGTEDGHVPERSFLRSTFDGTREEMIEFAKGMIWRVLDGSLSTDQFLGIVGSKMVSAVKATIRSNVPPPNAPSTIMRKARRGRTKSLFTRALKNVGGGLAQVGAAAAVKTLIDTGRMLNAVTWAPIRKGEK